MRRWVSRARLLENLPLNARFSSSCLRKHGSKILIFFVQISKEISVSDQFVEGQYHQFEMMFKGYEVFYDKTIFVRLVIFFLVFVVSVQDSQPYVRTADTKHFNSLIFKEMKDDIRLQISTIISNAKILFDEKQA